MELGQLPGGNGQEQTQGAEVKVSTAPWRPLSRWWSLGNRAEPAGEGMTRPASLPSIFQGLQTGLRGADARYGLGWRGV